MLIEVGARLGSYEVVAPIGAGSMGEIYRAFDTNLKRDVAIKVLPEALAQDEERLARLEREAHLLAAVNHPNIASIHNLEQVDGTRFLVLELIEGQSLARALAGPLAPQDALRVCGQVAEALEAAHKAGIVHRDLKPANIMVTHDGRAKVLDFGLAQVVAPGSDSSANQTKLTTTGMIVGTPPYMSPEQLRDQPLDSRTDIWAFGCVLYETLTGRMAFERDNVGDTVNAILEHEPDWSALPADTPMAVVSLLHECLQKDKASRLKDIRSAWVEIQGVLASSPDNLPTAALIRDSRNGTGIQTRHLWIGLGVVTVTAAVWVGVATFGGASGTALVPAPQHRQLTFVGDASDVAISPDGASIVYVRGKSKQGQRLMLADLAGGQPIEILHGSSVLMPVWSPDGSALTVAATVDQSPPFRIYRVPRLGGEARRLGRGVFSTWSPDGSRVAFTLESPRGFSVFTERTGEVEFVSLEGFDFNYGLSWSPSGNKLAVLTGTTATGTFEIVTVDPDGKNPRTLATLTDRLSSPRWAPSGESIYCLRHIGNLADLVRIDLGSGGEPAVVLSGLQPGDSFNISGDGRHLAYSRRLEYSNLWSAELSAGGADDAAGVRQLTTSTSRIEWPTFSPDGRWIAFAAETSTGANLFKMPAGGGDPVQLTFSDDNQSGPAWSPDGRSIAFSAPNTDEDGDGISVWVMASDGARPRQLPRTQVSIEETGITWSPGQRVLYEQPGNRNLSLLDVVTGEERPLLRDEARGWAFSPEYSPDGTRVALYGNRPSEGGSLFVVTLEPYTETIVATDPFDPIGWSADGAWIYVVKPGGDFVARVRATGGEIEVLFELPGEVFRGSVDPSGSRIVVPVAVLQSDVFLVENFDARAR